MIICPYCGRKLIDGATKCYSCKAAIPKAEVLPKEEPKVTENKTKSKKEK